MCFGSLQEGSHILSTSFIAVIKDETTNVSVQN